MSYTCLTEIPAQKLYESLSFMHFYKKYYIKYTSQECIPVGCVPLTVVAICWGVCLNACWDTLPPVWAWMPHWPNPPPSPLGLGLDTPPGQIPQPPTWVWAWTSPQPDPSIPPGSGPRHPPTVNRILDTRFWKYYLAPTSLRAVNIWAIIDWEINIQIQVWHTRQICMSTAKNREQFCLIYKKLYKLFFVKIGGGASWPYRKVKLSFIFKIYLQSVGKSQYRTWKNWILSLRVLLSSA